VPPRPVTEIVLLFYMYVDDVLSSPKYAYGTWWSVTEIASLLHITN
jgi:hypothetical protein